MTQHRETERLPRGALFAPRAAGFTLRGIPGLDRGKNFVAPHGFPNFDHHTTL